MGVDPGGGGTGRSPIRPAMNVTPLVDVVLVLLIIFMVITPLLTKQLYLRVPGKDDPANQQSPPADDAPPPVVLAVAADGAIRVNREAVSEAELSERLRRILAARRERVVFFDAADDAPYGRAVRVMDLARGGGATTIAVLPDPAPAP